MQPRHFDFLVIGSGLAGLYVALKAAQKGQRIALITKTWVRESNSYYAQGGIAAVTDEEDSPALHLQDTLEAGRGLCDRPAVEALVQEAPQRIQELIQLGMQFDRLDGRLELGLEGGHHHRRILHAGGDATGAMVTSFIANLVAREPRIQVFENHLALELLVRDNACHGVRTWHTPEQREALFSASNTCLALGGASAIYARTTNPNTTVGDGLALAYRAGCPIYDIEFVQFHPTAIYSPNGPAYLISEAVRGEGAHLLNERGVRFMNTPDYPLAELSPRDVVSQAIHRQIQNQENPFVWLSLEHLDPARILARFPTICRHCLEIGLNLTQRVPIAPAAHYTVGGVRTNLNGSTPIGHLYACGELAATGLMGANRLASNSLIECLVFGHRVVQHALQNTTPQLPPEEYQPRFTLDATRAPAYGALRLQIANLLHRDVGIVRSHDSLLRATNEIQRLEANIPADNSEFFAHQMRNLILVARLLINGATYRQESRGGHLRTDFPSPNPAFAAHTVQRIGANIGLEPVQ